MYPFDSLKHLVRDEEDGFEGKCAFAIFEELLERRAINVGDQNSVVMLNAIPVKIGNAHPALNNSIELRFSF